MSSVDQIPVDHILEQYDERLRLYQDFMNRQVTLLQEFIKENGPNVHSIVGRVKERDALRRKLLTSDSDFSELSDVEDIVGIRIITYFESEVDQIADIIHREYKIEAAHIIDRGDLMDPERFGYRPRYYSVSLLDNRLELIEYRRFKGCKAEIQVRSILQHAWAEIEREMGYTTRDAFPKEQRRQFSRVASLLELADEQFNEIKGFLSPLKESQAKEAEVEVTPQNITALVRSNMIIQELDERLAGSIGVKVAANSEFLEQLAENITFLGIENISTLERELRHRKKSILGIGKQVLEQLHEEKGFESIWEGATILFTCYALAAVSGRVDQILDYLKKTSPGQEPMPDVDTYQVEGMDDPSMDMDLDIPSW
ncbi:MAG: hypothetical protein HQL54_04060 [Magnetococcales bacterium]|nr:hypothetical protein [Magnetococcales bacterium]